MSDKPKKDGVSTNNGAVRQHHRMAEGHKTDGKSLPAAPAKGKTPGA